MLGHARTRQQVLNLHFFVYPNFFDLRRERKLANCFLLQVVPNHDLVRRPLGTVSTADEGHDVRSIDHLRDGDASVKVSFMQLQNFGVSRSVRVDFEATLSADDEAIIGLVEAH